MTDLSYEIIRSRRKSVCISVSPENKITVRCPLNFPEYKIQRFVENKKSWLEKIIKKNVAKLTADGSVVNYREIYVGGNKLPLIFADRNFVGQDAVYVKNIKALKKIFIAEFADEFLQRANDVSEQWSLHSSGFYFKSYKSRWGCCDKNGKITFNWVLFMLPPQIQRYVIVHELAHLVYFNHSKKFWLLVERLEPDYKLLRKKLKSFDFLTKLY